jgi:hypothetical protein
MANAGYVCAPHSSSSAPGFCSSIWEQPFFARLAGALRWPIIPGISKHYATSSSSSGAGKPSMASNVRLLRSRIAWQAQATFKDRATAQCFLFTVVPFPETVPYFCVSVQGFTPTPGVTPEPRGPMVSVLRNTRRDPLTATSQIAKIIP